MDVAQVLAEARLTATCSEAALAWCEEMGAEEIVDVYDEFDDFAKGLPIDPESKQILKREVGRVTSLGGDVAFHDLRKGGACEAGSPIRRILLNLFEGVKEQYESFSQPLPQGRAVDAIVVAESVSPLVIKECKDMGMPIFISTNKLRGKARSDTYHVHEMSEAGELEPVGVIKPFQPNMFEKRDHREEKPTAEVWSVPDCEANAQVAGDDGGGLRPVGTRLAKMMRPVAAVWAKMLRQRDATLTGKPLDASQLTKSTTDEGIIIYEKPPQSGVVVLGCGNSYGGMALAKFFSWSAFQSGGLQSKRVLELGAGTGIIGLTLGRLGAQVTLTDCEFETLQLMAHNVDANDLSSQVSAQFLEWGDESSYMAEETFDFIVAGESLYDAYGGEGNAMLLAHAITAHIKAGSGTVAYLAYRHRSEDPLRFFSAMIADGFRVARLENAHGEVVGCSLGPASAFDGSCFVEMADDFSLDVLRQPPLAPSNEQETQILRLNREWLL